MKFSNFNLDLCPVDNLFNAFGEKEKTGKT